MKKRNSLINLKERRDLMNAQVNSEQYLSRYLLAHFQKISNLKKELKRLPQNKEFMFLHTDKQFNAFTFIALVVEHHPIKHLQACSYSISKKVIDAMVELYDHGMIERITLLISDSVLHRIPGTVEHLKTLMKTRKGIQVRLAHVHAKIALIETHEAHYVIEGSGNWTDNASIEQYLFAQDVDLFRFRESIITQTPSKHEF